MTVEQGTCFTKARETDWSTESLLNVKVLLIVTIVAIKCTIQCSNLPYEMQN
jgi:hypothetical protein